jgi:Protein of unknown function (DUF4236)
MGWRFHKRIRLSKGVYWNIGKRGSSLSVGRRGATVNISKKGVRRTYSIPGTGLSYTSTTSQAGGCLLVFGIVLLAIFAPSHKTTTTTGDTTEVQYSPSPTAEFTLTPQPSAIATPLEVRRAIPVTTGTPAEVRRAIPVTAASIPEFSQTALHDAEKTLNQVWNRLTANQRTRLRREEQKWAKYMDSLPEDKQLEETRDRTLYLLHVAD